MTWKLSSQSLSEAGRRVPAGRIGPQDAGVRDVDIDRAQLGLDTIEEGRNLGLLRHIDFRADPAQGLRRLFRAIEIGQGDPGAAGMEGLGHGKTDPAGPARYRHYLVGIIHQRLPERSAQYLRIRANLSV